LIVDTTNILMARFDFTSISTGVKDEIWFYEGGIWKLKGKDIIRINAERLLGNKAKMGVVREIEEKIKRLTFVDKEKFDNIPEGYICLSNGILNLLEKKLMPHSSLFYFKTKINLIYDPKATCEKILEF